MPYSIYGMDAKKQLEHMDKYMQGIDISFSRNLIKGKIVELIFEQMFRTSEEFTIIPIGYEHTIPELAQYQKHVQIQKVLENIRLAPDFALISQDKTKVFLIEVKYRLEFTKEEMLNLASTLFPRWNLCFLFVATKDKFYFSPCSSIITQNGKIEELRESWISKNLQNEYISLMQEFIPS